MDFLSKLRRYEMDPRLISCGTEGGNPRHLVLIVYGVDYQGI